jgi:hypothetical protein
MREFGRDLELSTSCLSAHTREEDISSKEVNA